MEMAYHGMKKAEKEIDSLEENRKILKKGRFAVIALSSMDEPYIVTLSYGFAEEPDRLYFHTAMEGLKLKIMEENPKCAATVIEDLGYIHGECSHKFRSVVLFGKISPVETLQEKKFGMRTMFHHLEKDPDAMNERFLSKDSAYSRLMVLRLDVEGMRGKESR